MKDILLIDDSRAVHAFVEEILTRKGYRLVHAFHGEEGLQKLAAEKYSLVLLDWEMPVLDGPSTLRRLRASESTTPVMMLTSKSSVENIREMLAAGAADYVMKPFTEDILLGKIQSLLEGA